MSQLTDTNARLEACLELVEPVRKRGDVQFWGVLGVLPCFLLGARFGLELAPVPALGAALAGWLPVLLLWWNRHAEREHARLVEAAAHFDAAFPVKGIGRPQALEALARIAAKPGHERRNAAHLLIDELETQGSAPLEDATRPPRAFVAPDIEYRGAGAFTGNVARPIPAGEPLLPPELQDAIPGTSREASPPAPVEPREPATGETARESTATAPPGRAPRPDTGPGANDGDEPDTFDYIPLEPHDPKR